jgi:hypothetical protein
MGPRREFDSKIAAEGSQGNRKISAERKGALEINQDVLW